VSHNQHPEEAQKEVIDAMVKSLRSMGEDEDPEGAVEYDIEEGALTIIQGSPETTIESPRINLMLDIIDECLQDYGIVHTDWNTTILNHKTGEFSTHKDLLETIFTTIDGGGAIVNDIAESLEKSRRWGNGSLSIIITTDKLSRDYDVDGNFIGTPRNENGWTA